MKTRASAEYQDIITSKYSSADMRNIFSEFNIVKTYRKCWVALAEAENELGLKMITKPMIAELKANVENIDFDAIHKKEDEIKHDIMAQIYAYGLVCPKAKGIIHLGETSQFVKCNTDIIQQKEGLLLIRKQLAKLLNGFELAIKKYMNIPTLSYTHYQPAQPTTIGRRFCIYAQDLLSDIEEIDKLIDELLFRGVKGTTGTQASFMDLFEGNIKDKIRKIEKLDILVSKKLGFSKVYQITTQTYSRKQDLKIAELLANICATCKKFSIDMRLMSNLGIMEEGIGKNQVGSSAMPYKRNPMKSERISSLARKVMNNTADFFQTYSEQWLERSLDDSAIRRIDIPQNFMLTEYILIMMNDIIEKMEVYEKMSIKLLNEELPFMSTEKILMQAVKLGKDRQEVHEQLRKHSFRIRTEGLPASELFDMIERDPKIGIDSKFIKTLKDPESYIGLSIPQAENFLKRLKSLK